MKNMKRILTLMTLLALVISMFAGCGKKDGGETTDPAANGNNVAYTVNVKTVGGMAMEGVAVSAYADEALTDMKGYGQTDANGTASISLPEGGQYYVSLSGVPKGYALEKFYRFNGISSVPMRTIW